MTEKKLALVNKYEEALKKLGQDVDRDLLIKVVTGLGPSIYKRDAELVSCGDQVELDRVKNNFIIKKLSLDDNSKADTVIQEVCEIMKNNKAKFRAVFYYIVVSKLNKSSVYSK